MSPPIDANRLLAVVAEVAREARPHFEAYVTLDSSLERELGLDSLARVELVLRLEREFAASLPEQALASSETPRDLLRFVLAGAGQAQKAADRTVASLVQAEGVRPPDSAQTLTEALEYHAHRQPERLTVHLYEEGDEKTLTYRVLWDGALLYAARLAEAGVTPGQSVAIMLPTCREYLFCFYGVLLAGSIGSPKGVVLTHANLLANVRAMGKAAHATSEDVFVSWLPLYHDMGLIGGCFATMYLGFPVVLMSPLAFLSRPSQWLRAIHRHPGTISGGPNFSYEPCLRRIPEQEPQGLDLASWRFAFNGAEPASADT